MKKRAFSLMITAAMAMAMCVAGCGAYAAEADTTEATEAENEASDEAESMPEVDEGFFVAGFFSDTVSTYYKDADAVSDIVTGIDDMEFAEGAATADDIAGCIQADADLVAVVTYDAEDVDFEVEGEYDIVYRVFISTEDLQDYLEVDETEDTADIESDYIDICIPGTVVITEADGEAEAGEADEETDDAEGVTVAEVNEMTWTYDLATSIPDVVSGIGSIEYDAEDAEAEDADEVYFDADAEIADAVLYDESRVDAEGPDAEDVAYFTYFDREALLDYMDKEDIDPAEYPGLTGAYTDHIMVYYGPITELDLMGVLEGVVDHYVLQNAENIDYEYGVTYDGDVVTNVTADAGDVDLSEPGTYTVKYTVTVDTKALEEAADIEEVSEDGADEEAAEEGADTEETADDAEEAADDGSSEDADAEDGVKEVVIEKEVTVVTPEEADELVGEGKTVWTDDNEEYGKTGEAAADTAAKGSTEVAANDTKADTVDNSPAADTGSTSSGSSNSSSSGSGSSGSGSGSSGSSGGSSGSSSGSTQHTHDWQPVYHEEQGHYESVKVQDAWTEQVATGSENVCNGCGATQSSIGDFDHFLLHTINEGCGYHSETQYTTINHDAVYEDRYVVDTPAYTTYVCSGCGATK